MILEPATMRDRAILVLTDLRMQAEASETQSITQQELQVTISRHAVLEVEFDRNWLEAAVKQLMTA